MPVKWKACSEERFDEALGSLPPAIMRGSPRGFLVGEAYNHRRCTVSGEVTASYRPYVQFDGFSYEAQHAMTVSEFKALTAADVLANLETEGAANV